MEVRDWRAKRIWEQGVVSWSDGRQMCDVDRSGGMYLEWVHGFAVGAVRLEDPGRDVHDGAKGLSEQDQHNAFVSDPEGAEGASPAMPGRSWRGRG